MPLCPPVPRPPWPYVPPLVTSAPGGAVRYGTNLRDQRTFKRVVGSPAPELHFDGRRNIDAT